MLLKHDKPMHRKAGHIPHLRHLPAYLRDPAVVANEVAAAGAAAAAAAQRQPKQKGPKAKKHKAAAAAQDPLKAAAGAGAAGGGSSAAAAAGGGSTGAAAAAAGVSGGVFMKAAKKGGSAADEELTELERRALAKPLKPSKAQVLQGVGGAALKAKVLGPKVAAALAQGANKRNVRTGRPKMGAGAKRRR